MILTRAARSAAAWLACAALPGQFQLPDIPLATVSGRALFIDLYFPSQDVRSAPLVLWIHGGGWVSGNRKLAATDAAHLTSLGYAVAAIEYRLSGQADWPAQVHDCKGAVRWLRAHATLLGIDPWRFIAFGESAGGQLAAVLAASGGDSALEGTVGGHLEESSRVQGAISLMAPHNFFSLSGFHLDPNSFESLLLGAALGQIQRLQGTGLAAVYEWRARTASTEHWLDRSDPPIMFGHGMLDPIYPWSQSYEAHRSAPSLHPLTELHLDETAGHSMPPSMYALRDDWLRRTTNPAARVRIFGSGIPLLDGNKPSIGVIESTNGTTITLDGAPPGAIAVAALGSHLGNGFWLQPAEVGPPVQTLFTPNATVSTNVDAQGQASIPLPLTAPGTVTYCQWIVLYFDARQRRLVATTGGARVR